MRTKYLLAALPLTCLFAGNAFAQACTKPLTLRSEIQMESSRGGPSTIPVKINGTDQKLTLATAGTTTQISETTAKALNLETSRSDMMLPDFTGNLTRVDQVTIADFSMPGLHGTNLKWPVSAGGGRFGGGGGGGGAAGLFSLNYMRAYDIDVDFGSDKLRLFNQDHCPGGVLYWKAAGAVAAVPITVEDGKVTVPVMVDGKAIKAVIDTAAFSSSVRTAVADRVLGVQLGGASAPADVPSKNPFAQTYQWTPKTLTIGPLSLSGAKVAILADLNVEAGTDAHGARARRSGIEAELANPEVTLGMDVLRKLHIYMAFGENKLYATETSSAAPAEAAKTP
jgi:predicted aspartyl protease